MTHILIVEDDPALVELLTYNLESEGFETEVANDGEAAVLALDERPPDMVILDWMLPGLSGIDVCRRIRKAPRSRALPVIMLTARGEERDKVQGLEVGADDYMVKPFSPGELIARVRALMRRSNPALAADELSYADVVMDLGAHKVTRGGEPVKLGPTEFRLLRALLEYPSQVFSRDRLLDKVWGRDIYVEQRTVDVHIRRLRKVLNAGGKADVIRTVRGAGYALDSQAH